jgi:hypothetical protein
MKMAKKPEVKERYHVPLQETLKWIDGGEAILANWREQKGNAAKQMAEAMARRLLKLRKDAKALKQLSSEKQEKKMKSKKNK